MALNCSTSLRASTLILISVPIKSKNPIVSLFFSSSSETPKLSLRISVSSTQKARFIARRKESVLVRQLGRPLIEYMSLPASQYSVLDAERIERVDDNTFRCYLHRFKFFAFEVCPILLVRVEEQPNGCFIKLLSCKLEGSPMVVAQNERFDAAMVNHITCGSSQSDSSVQQLISDAVIEVSIDVPSGFGVIPVQAIESTGTRILEQILGLVLPRFMSQVVFQHVERYFLSLEATGWDFASMSKAGENAGGVYGSTVDTNPVDNFMK